MITLRPANPTCKVELSNLIYLASDKMSFSSKSERLILVEFPAVLYNSFEGVLRCLQSLHKDPAYIPFTTWLAPLTSDNKSTGDLEKAYSDRKVVVPPPAYFLSNVTIDLSCIPPSTNNKNSSNSATSPPAIYTNI